MKWFGKPWPSPAYRAEVCSQISDRIPVPVEQLCQQCNKRFFEYDRGVAMPFVDGSYWTDIYYHAQCWLAVVIGEKMAAEIASKWEPVDRY